MLNNIRIVLLETSHPGNIGSTARAMKTMGLGQLYLVNPKRFPSAEAIAMASNADDILEQAVVVDSLAAAIADCHVVFGTSSRDRYLEWPQLDSREAGVKVIESVGEGNQIAIVFGNERTGMTNEELQQCHYHVHIPTNPNYASLNLSQAVQIVCYEVRMAQSAMLLAQRAMDPPVKLEDDHQKERLTTQEEMAGLYDHLEEALTHIQFIHPQQATPPMRRLKRLFQRAHCTDVEVNILRGICKKILVDTTNSSSRISDQAGRRPGFPPTRE